MTVLRPSDLGTVLGVWAHPDDEAYLSGGLMAVARQAGQRVVVVTATRGEHGTADPERWPPHRLAAVRDTEIRASLAALDVTEHHFLGYGDGSLPAQDQAEAIGRIGAVMAAVRPDTVLTFGPDGLTGHRDHRQMCHWTTAARNMAAPAARLLYATTTDAFVERWRDVHDQFAIYLEPGLPLRTPPRRIALELTLDDALADRKLVALRAQASQTAGLIAAMGEARYRQWISTEAFTTAAGATTSGPRPAELAGRAPMSRADAQRRRKRRRLPAGPHVELLEDR